MRHLRISQTIWNIILIRLKSLYYEQALWSQINNLHRVCIKFSSLIMKYLYY